MNGIAERGVTFQLRTNYPLIITFHIYVCKIRVYITGNRMDQMVFERMVDGLSTEGIY